MRYTIIIFVLLIILIGCGTKTNKQAPLFDNLGTMDFPVTTNSELAQKYINQGIILAYGFNHEEAFRSFEEAARLDSNCAMAYWGVAMCNFHALWRPPRVDDLKKGSLAIKIARSLKEKTE
ncbi:MAG: hypothetical protein IIB08_07300, partial [Bacteroidetes bacterium]|nr:hypothetical protein [Bacteroidota bacterium]